MFPPILQDPLPWQQKVRFAKGIASGMVSLGTNLASELAGEAGPAVGRDARIPGRPWRAARAGWAASAELLAEPVNLTPVAALSSRPCSQRIHICKGRQDTGKANQRSKRAQKGLALQALRRPASEGLWGRQTTSLPGRSEEGEP